MTASSPWTAMFEEYFRLKRQNTAILAWQMGDWFEFYFDEAEWVSAVLGIALTTRGKGPKGEPIPMCAVPADARFTVHQDCLLVPLEPTDHYFGQFVEAGQSLAIALHADGRGASIDHRIVAIFHREDFVQPARSGINLVGRSARLKAVQ